jgi:lysophospholipase L1-like esterase
MNTMRNARFGILLSFFAILLIAGCSEPVANRDSHGSTIVCFGDSLTSGYGAGEGEDYPADLGHLVALPVINSGVAGDTTRDALDRLEADVLEQNPRLVIITLGGNNFLKHVPKEETLANMGEIIDKITAKGAMVVWATVKTSLFGDSYQQDFADLAKRKRIVLIPNILKGILFDPRYKFDEIHPNSAGYRLMAERIYKRIKPLIK